jgi:DNA-binding GntR family transcriptional regulator
MQNLKPDTLRQTSTDRVFEHLHDAIVSLEIPPGSKLSEAEVAQQFGVSRQPVRDAFSRLCHLKLLRIRPQKPTVVRGFTEHAVTQSRFIRLAVELEVINRACGMWDAGCSRTVQRNLDQQRAAVAADQWEEFHQLDFQFHALICEISNTRHAIDAIESCRRATDRMCILSLDRDREVDLILDDHQHIANALEKRNAVTASGVMRQHLSRLDSIIEEVKQSHAEYFE